MVIVMDPILENPAEEALNLPDPPRAVWTNVHLPAGEVGREDQGATD